MKYAALAATLVLAACSSQSASRAESPLPSLAQPHQRSGVPDFTAKVLYSFPLNARAKSPIFPSSVLLADTNEALYGATSATAGLRGGIGSLFKLIRKTHEVLVIARFGRKAGSYPSGVIADKTGALYGTTSAGGDLRCLGHRGCGTVFKLLPSGSSFEREVLHRFQGGSDGIEPSGGVAVDAGGAIFGVTRYGGGSGCGGFGCGTVFRLSPPASSYREKVLYRFGGGSDGSAPVGGVVLDSRGNLYGVTVNGGRSCSESKRGCGTVFELQVHGSSYNEVILYRFAGRREKDGAFPISLVRNVPSDTLYGTTLDGGANECSNGGCGTVFELTRSEADYAEMVLASFEPAPGGAPPEPSGVLLRDNELYGVTAVGGSHTSSDFPNGAGTAFAIDASTGAMNTIYEFRGAPDGAEPVGGLTAGRRGMLYGATARGGTGDCAFFTGCGTIYRLSP
jgi:hypothetical protein